MNGFWGLIPGFLPDCEGGNFVHFFATFLFCPCPKIVVVVVLSFGLEQYVTIPC